MAEGIVFGVLGLIPLCKEGYDCIKAVFDAPEAAGEALVRFELQRQVFAQWAERWKRISRGATSEASARRIFRQITAICALFSDARSLRKKLKLRRKFKLEWIKLEPAEPDPPTLHLGQVVDKASIEAFKESCKANMDFIHKCKYGWSGDAKWDDLILLLAEYNDNLYRLGLAGTPMFLATNILPSDRKTGYQLIEAAKLEARSRGPLTEEYQQLLAVLRARFARQPSESDCLEVARVPGLLIKDNYYKLHDGKRKETATMAHFEKENKHYATLVEWTNLTENKAARTSLLLKSLSSDITLVPTSFGIAKAMGPNKRHGVLLGLPNHFGTFRGVPNKGDISEMRMAHNLEEMIGQQPKDLTVRLRVARRLVSAVHAMHVAQFVHKNIRSSIILFFPKLDQNLEHPMITGFNHSHHKEITEESQSDEENGFYDVYKTYGNDRWEDAQAKAQQQDIRLDYYQHPDKRDDLTLHYQARHDLYSLACVLLEIGLWKTIKTAIEDIDWPKKTDVNKLKPADAQERVRELARPESLDQFVGQIYGDFVRECLDMDAGEFSLRRERELVERLRSCNM